MARKTDQPSTSRKTSKRAVAPMVVSRDEQPAAEAELAPPPPPTTTPRASSPSILISRELRAHMIAEGAYYRAAARGFAPGHEVEDWLAAEAAIDEQLAN